MSVEMELVCTMCNKPITTPSPVYEGWCIKCDERYGYYADYYDDISTYEPIKSNKRSTREE